MSGAANWPSTLPSVKTTNPCATEVRWTATWIRSPGRPNHLAESITSRPLFISVAVHRTSVAHGFVVFTDGNALGQLAAPGMRLPIGYALAYPDRFDDRPRCDD